MDKEKKLIIFELIATIIAFIIFLIWVIYFFPKDNEKKETKEEYEILTSEPISEEPQTADLLILQVPKVQHIEEVCLETIINNDKVEENIIIEEIIEIEVNPYTELIENLTEYEKTLIYKITFAEAGNQEEEGQRAVIEVILNRVLSDDFPNTVEGVLSQKHQFATWGVRSKVRQVDQDRIINILELVAIETPVLPNLEYVFFARGKQTRYATDFIKIQDHWFGAAK